MRVLKGKGTRLIGKATGLLIPKKTASTSMLIHNSQLKPAFQAATAAEDIPAAQVLRNFMRAYVESRQRQDFVAEAKRQFAIIAASSRDPASDEHKVM